MRFGWWFWPLLALVGAVTAATVALLVPDPKPERPKPTVLVEQAPADCYWLTPDPPDPDVPYALYCPEVPDR